MDSEEIILSQLNWEDKYAKIVVVYLSTSQDVTLKLSSSKV